MVVEPRAYGLSGTFTIEVQPHGLLLKLHPDVIWEIKSGSSLEMKLITTNDLIYQLHMGH